METQTVVTPLEPLDMVQRFFNEEQEALIRCSLLLDGRLNLATLDEALRHVARVVPATAGTFDPRISCWRTYTGTARGMLGLVTCTEDEFDRSVRAALLAHLNPAAGPQLRVTVVRRPTGPDALVIRASHMLCDFSSFRDLIALLAASYTMVDRDLQGVRDARGLSVPQTRGLSQLTRNIPADRIAHILIHDPRMPRQDLSQAMPETDGPTCPRLVRRDIDPETFSQARDAARSLGATVNDLLLAAYGRTLCSAMGTTSVVLPCPVDLRRYARPGQTTGICNLSGLDTVRVSSYVHEPLRDTIENVSRQMRVAKAADSCLRDVLMSDRVFKMVPFEVVTAILKASGKPERISYTNLGVTDSSQMVFGQVRAQDMEVATATRQWPSFQLSAHTFDGTLSLTAATDASDEAMALGQEVLDVTAEQIELIARRG